jgi:hypothetical protein
MKLKRVILGIVIGDLVKVSLSEQKAKNKYLRNYFYGHSPRG